MLERLKHLIDLKKPSHKAALFYTSSSLIKSFINIISGFILLRFVSPEEVGIWQGIFIASTYAAFLNFGVPTGLHREIPYLHGRGEKEKACLLASSAKFLSFSCFYLSLVLLLLGVIYLKIHNQSNIIIFSFTGVFLIIAISFLHNFYIVLYRSNQAFIILSKINYAESTILILLFPLIIYKGYNGYILYQVLNHLIFLLLLVLFNPIKSNLKLRLPDILHLAKIGFPIFIMNYLYGIGKSFLKFALLFYGGVQLLGIFAPVFAIINGIKMLPIAISRFFYPSFSYQLGKTGNTLLLWLSVKKITLVLLTILSIIFLPLILIIPFIIENYFPKYIESIIAIQMVIASGIISASFIGVNALNSLNSIKSRFYITLIYLLCSMAFPFIVPKFFQNYVFAIALSIILIDITSFITSWLITKSALLNVKTNS